MTVFYSLRVVPGFLLNLMGENPFVFLHPFSKF
jgi:hypothetical protein